jgi:hypothetical protein
MIASIYKANISAQENKIYKKYSKKEESFLDHINKNFLNWYNF